MNIEQRDDSPLVAYDEKNHTLLIQGKTYMHDAFAFYENIRRWIASREDVLQISIDLIYINSTSSQAILDFFEALQVYKEKVPSLKVVWKFDEDNSMMEEAGEEYQSEFDTLEIILAPYSA